MEGKNSVAAAQLLEEVAGLADEEILALCYVRRGPPERLWLYMNALRRRPGRRAQFASCLICFDLAREGDVACQGEFLLLAGTMRALAGDGDLAHELVGDDPYLGFVWDLCRASLEEAEDSAAAAVLVPPTLLAGQAMAELNLLSEQDLPELGDWHAAADTEALWRRFDDAVEAYLGGTVGVPMYDGAAGFRLHGSRDLQRLEQFVQRLESLAEQVPPARGFYALALLFYGSQMRSRTLFGSVNQRKQEVLRAGIAQFIVHANDVHAVAGVLGEMHADADAWPRIATILLAYVRHLARGPTQARAGVAGFSPAELI